MQMSVLSHLVNTLNWRIDDRMDAVVVYARRDGESYTPFGATGEGYACVDDTARAAILALELYEDTSDDEALSQALRWMEFVAHMTNSSGKVANFMLDDTTINERGDTSYRGGQWWQARSLCALARAYRVTRDNRWLDLYWSVLRMTKPQEGRTIALVNLAKIDLLRASVSSTLAPLSRSSYRMGETFGYHQLLCGVLMHRYQGVPLLFPKQSINEYIEPMVNDGFWSEYKSRSKDHLCAYNVSPIVQGLAAICEIEPSDRYLTLLRRSMEWFYSDGLYDPTTGVCLDGLDSEDAGAESSIEAGLAQLAYARVGS